MKQYNLLADSKVKIVFIIFMVLFSAIFTSKRPKVWGAGTANSWTVCDINCDFTLIQAAVNDSQVQNGDTLQIKFNAIHTEANMLVDKSLTFTGLGEDVTTIQAASTVVSATNRIFTILDGVDVTIQDMTLQHGNAAANSSSNKNGGAIWKGDGALTLNRVKILNNEAVAGGGIASEGGTLNIINTRLEMNMAWSHGGGINSQNTILNLSNGDSEHLIKTNISTNGNGGGIYLYEGALSLQDYRLEYNNGQDQGGGIYIFSSQPAIIDNAIIYGNSLNDSDSSLCGGAGISSQANLTITNSSITQNYTHDGGTSGNDCDGGGIYVPYSDYDLTVADTVVKSNQANAGDPGGSGGGGGIYFQGDNLSINDSLLETNDGKYGSALAATGSTHMLNNVVVYLNDGGPAIFLGSTAYMELNGVDIRGNESDARGGGIAAEALHEAPATLKISHSQIRENSAAGGAGIYAWSFDESPDGFPLTILIDHTQIMSNSAYYVADTAGFDGYGGGLWVSAATLTMTHSLVSGNSAEGDGGGFYVHGKPEVNLTNALTTAVYLINSTVSGNSTVNNGGGIGVGDALNAGEMYLMNMTISHNEADTEAGSGANGGGIYKTTELVDVTMMNSILAGNSDYSPNLFSARGPDCVGENFNSMDYNIIGSLGSGGPIIPPNPPPPPPCSVLTQASDQVGVSAADLALDTLQDNGGSSATHALLAGSVAINAGDPTGCKQMNGVLLETDQRDYARPDRCDIGAYEYNGIEPPPPTSGYGVYLPFIQR